MSLAIFDLDNTLLAGDSDHAWGEFLCQEGIVDTEAYRLANDRFYHQYLNGTLDIREFLGFALKPLAEHPREEMEALRARFLEESIKPMITAKSRALLAEHRAKGDFLLIITATNRFVTGPIGELLGVDDLLATDPEIIDGKYTGNYAGIPCFQDGKVVRLDTWLEETGHSLEGACFYSDSNNDLPLLEKVDHPFAVNPDEKLTAIANARNWPILDLHSDN